MVAHLVRLKLALLRNSLRRSPMQLVGIIFGAAYGLFILVMLWIGMALLSTQDASLAALVITLGGSAVLLGWLLIPVLASGVDMTLDPARFTTYAIPMRSLLVGLALSSFVGVPAAVTLLASLGTVVAWWRHPLAAGAAVVCAVLAVLTCIVASRAMTAASMSLAASRRFKDVSGIVLLAPLVCLGPIIAGVSTGVTNLRAYLPALAGTLSWTPLGAVWAVPGDLAAGSPGTAAAKFLVALATAAALAWLWKASLAQALVTPAYNAGKSRAAGNTGFFRRFPGTPTGAVAARALTYWFRDPRYSAGLVIGFLLPVVLSFAGISAGTLSVLGYAGSLAVFLIVWSISADISYDNTAFALHVSSGVGGFADRAGRALACALLAVPLGAVYAIAGAILGGNWWHLPGTLALVLGVAGSGLGIASVFSAQFTYNVPLPGDSPLKSRPGNNLATVLVQLAGMAGMAVLVLPEAVLVIVALATGQILWAWLALAAALVLGALFLVLGLRLGGRIYDRRAPELLLAVSRNA
ncbi:transporter [Specibacter cremeus]|uniref:transporter n=1 Tax=Specibacter cremeus TaxID=1629051 RepID=UPI000F7A8B76|nr:transporter [Specibacter cremeus]